MSNALPSPTWKHHSFPRAACMGAESCVENPAAALLCPQGPSCLRAGCSTGSHAQPPQAAQCGKQPETQMEGIRKPCLLVCHAWGLGWQYGRFAFQQTAGMCACTKRISPRMIFSLFGCPNSPVNLCSLSVKAVLGSQSLTAASGFGLS